VIENKNENQRRKRRKGEKEKRRKGEKEKRRKGEKGKRGIRPFSSSPFHLFPLRCFISVSADFLKI